MAQHAARKPRPWWQQATALVTVSTGGVITGLNFAPGTPATMTDPGGLPLHLLALEMSANGGLGGTASGTAADAQSRDTALRTAIVNIAQRYLNLAKSRSSAEMEALIWGGVSTDGADHGPSCAAFASLTLELGAQLVGQQSWVTGGDTYPWPIHEWAEPRVDANPASLAVTSIVQDAQRHDRWHPVGGGYSPQPGDWVLFDEHVEVVTSYRGGELHTIGANSLPGYTVNAHTLTGSLAGDGVQGFVDNGHLAVTRTPAPATSSPGREPAPTSSPPSGQNGSAQSAPATPAAQPTGAASPAASQPSATARPPAAGGANIPGVTPAAQPTARPQPRASRPPSPRATAPQATPSHPAARPQGPQAAPAPAASPQAARPRTPAPRVAGAQPTARIPGVGTPQVTSSQALPAPQAAGGQHASGQPEARIPGTATAGGAGSQQQAAPQPRPAQPAGGKPKASHARAARPTVRRPHARTTASQADIPGLMPPGNPAAPTGATPPAHAAPAHTGHARTAPATPAATPTPAPTTRPSPKPYARHSAPPSATPPGTSPQAAFIGAVAPGAMAAQQRWGVPAAVTIAQAIEESAWGQSSLAASYHNLFGIKGSGPAGSVSLPTQEFEGGQWVTVDAPFRVYHNDAESISDHAQLLATSSYYTHAMTDRSFPDAFANDLTGVYATDPHYGANLIALMKLYNLYQYDVASAPTHAAPTHPAPTHPAPAPTASSSPTRQPSPVPSGTSAPTATPTATPAPTVTPTPTATPTPAAASSSPQGQPRIPGAGPASGSAQGPRPARQPRPRAAATTAAPRRTAAARNAAIPGLPGASSAASYGTDASYGAPASYGLPPGQVTSTPAATGTQTMAFVERARPAPARVAPRPARPRPERIYDQDLPDAVRTAFFASARTPIARAEPMYKDIANQAGISWKLLAACDWMQCQAQPHLSPVHGERLGTLNSDGTVYSTKSAALAQCATDLVELALAVYGIDLTVPRRMSISALANVFAAFRWGGLLRKHQVSSLEFPYSVEGLTEGHMKMRWPAIDEPNAPDRPGARFRAPFGAVPVVLSLNYRAVV